MWHVGEQGAKRDEELDSKVARESGDDLGEGTPPVVGLDSEQEHGIAIGTRDRGGMERRLGPFDLPRDPVGESHGGTRTLEVDETLGIDLREPLRIPESCEGIAGERRRLAAVVPAAERCDQHGPTQGRHLVDSKLGLHAQSLAAASRRDERRHRALQ